ncbi:VOC family protein [Cumulibacter manganitolerans]|uniref:VOC family protein n=1 Tax=Cumulibacter manganitolerans TaxID=1884992 RepID=UPI0012956E70|nr:VOC family protein [Cumulibacter manganitolerans]
MTDIDPHSRIDHLVYGVLDLQKAVDDIEQQIGVRPVEGGRHLGHGTRNYLLGLSPTSYLEIIALDGENPAADGHPTAFHLDRLREDRLVAWCIHPGDIDGALVKSRRHNADHGKLTPMSRVDNEGNELHWTLAKSDDLPYGGLAPFLIDWGDSVHPASSGIPHAELLDLEVGSPDADAVNGLYRDLGIDVVAVTADEPRLRATIAGPTGTVSL